MIAGVWPGPTPGGGALGQKKRSNSPKFCPKMSQKNGILGHLGCFAPDEIWPFCVSVSRVLFKRRPPDERTPPPDNGPPEGNALRRLDLEGGSPRGPPLPYLAGPDGGGPPFPPFRPPGVLEGLGRGSMDKGEG